jgi:hypothetical protein
MTLTAAGFILISRPAFAEWLSPDLRMRSNIDISILINDDAVGGCWTNAEAVRRLADLRMRGQGYQIYQPRDGIAYLLISVTAQRDGDSCVGMVGISLRQEVFCDGRRASLLLGEVSGYAVQTGSMNRFVEETLERFILLH